MSNFRPPATEAQKRHYAAALHYAERHFTDPVMHAEDAAICFNISERTQRESLRACGTTWREITRSLRLERAAELLRRTRYEVAVVARLSGYRSAPALAAVFKERYEMSPAQWRRGFGGPVRAGGPTGAANKPAERARALVTGAPPPPPRRDGWTAGDSAVQRQEIAEAQERIYDRRILSGERLGGISIEALAAEVANPRHLRDEPEYWRARRAEFDDWVAEHDPSWATGSPPSDPSSAIDDG